MVIVGYLIKVMKRRGRLAKVSIERADRDRDREVEMEMEAWLHQSEAEITNLRC